MKKNLLYYILHPDHLLVVLFTLLLMRILVSFALDISFLNPVERSIENFHMTDVFYDIYKAGEETDTSDLITIVDMTQVYDRDSMAYVLTELDMMEPAVLGVDVIFHGMRDGQREQSTILLDAVRNITTPTVWAKKLENWSEEEEQYKSTIHSFFSDSLKINEGSINVHNDLHGEAVRTIATQRKAEGETTYSFPVKMAVAFYGDSSFLDYKDDINIRYTKTYFPVVPYNKLAENYDRISGHIVLLGGKTDPSDQRYTPLGLTSGVEILAYAVQTITERKMPREWSDRAIFLLSIFLMWVVQVMCYFTTQTMLGSRKKWIHDFAECDFAGSLLNIIVIFILVGFSFYHFVHNNVYINMGWAIAGIAAMEFSRKLYFLLIAMCYSGLNMKWLKHSLAHRNWEERQPYFQKFQDK